MLSCQEIVTELYYQYQSIDPGSPSYQFQWLHGLIQAPKESSAEFLLYLGTTWFMAPGALLIMGLQPGSAGKLPIA